MRPNSRVKTRILPRGTPVQIVDRSEITGVTLGHYFEKGSVYYTVDWLVDGYAPSIASWHVSEMSALHLLASC